MKEWIKKNKNGITIGVISSILTAVIIKVYHFLINAAPSAGNSLFSKLRDCIYYEAGHKSPYILVSILFSTVFCLYFTYTFSTIIKALRITQTKIDSEKVANLLDSLEKRNADDPNFKPDLEKAKRIHKRIKKANNSNTTETNPRKDKAILIALTALFILYAGYIFAYEIVPATMWHSFEIAITQITPYVDDQQVKKLRSQWVSMDSRDDYIVIDNYIKSVKLENGL